MGRTAEKIAVGLLGCLVLALAVMVAPQATAATSGRPDGLDPSFGRGGRVLAKPPREIEPTAFAAAARGPNGDVLLDLHRQSVGGHTVSELEMRLSSGELDPSFGTGGRLAAGPGKILLALPDGNFLVGPDGCGKSSSLMEIDSTGAKVPGFGRGGCGPSIGFGIERLALDPQGRILLAGPIEYCSPCSKDIVPSTQTLVARLLPNGSVDRSFGANGSIGTNSTLKLEGGGYPAQLRPEGLAATADGGVVLSAGDEVIRLDPNGSLDTAFGEGGVAKGPGAAAGPVVVQPDGSIELVSVDTSEEALFVTKFDADGKPDPGFGNAGTTRIATPSLQQQYELAATAAPSGAVLVASHEPYEGQCDGCTHAPFLVRLTAAGQPDPSFGDAGVAIVGPTPPYLPSPGTTNALLVGPDGSTLLAGVNSYGEALLSALTPAGAPDPSLEGSGTLLVHREKPTQLGPTGLALRPDGGLALLSDRSDATGYTAGHLLDFSANGRQLRGPGGSIAAQTATNGALVPVSGGFLVWEEEEARDKHLLHAFRPDGAELAKFGDDGTVKLPRKLVPQAIEPAPDGGCVVVGSTGTKAMAIYRLGPDGRPLKSFGHDGLAFAFRGEYSIAYDALVEADGDTVVTGWDGDRVGIARLRPDGTLDGGFGHGGSIEVALGEKSFGDAIAAWPGGGVVIAATQEGAKHHKSTSLLRLDRHGRLVQGFGRRGVVHVGTENRPLGLLISGRRIVVVTNPIFEGEGRRAGVDLRAFLPDGAVDRRFAHRGNEHYGGGKNGPYFLPAAAVAQPRGRIVVGGTAAYGHRHTKAELVRFLVP